MNNQPKESNPSYRWIDCIDMPDSLTYEEINKSSFRHKETLMPVLATGFDSSYGAIRNHEGEYILMEDLQYLSNGDEFLTPQEYTEKYYTHQSNDGPVLATEETKPVVSAEEILDKYEINKKGSPYYRNTIRSMEEYANQFKGNPSIKHK